jgi:predicted secreted protein
MNLTATLATFGVVWWLVFFMALPIGVRHDEEPVPGADRGAPAKPHLLLKVLGTTVVAALATWALVWALDSGLIDFRPPPGTAPS